MQGGNITTPATHPAQNVNTKSQTDEEDYDDDEDEDIKHENFISRWWKNKVKKGLNDAFRNPDDEDGDDY